MELMNKKATMIRLALLVFLLGFTATVNARFDPTSFIAQVVSNGDATNYNVKFTAITCCNKCICTKTIPSVCRCVDVVETCRSGCYRCICPGSSPPQCYCDDIIHSRICHKKCN